MRIAKVLLLAGVTLTLASAGQAAFMFDWSASQPHKIYFDDPTGDQVGLSGRDIVAVWWGRDADYTYFRMDMDVEPTIANGFGDMYGVYVDARPGVSGGATTWIPSELNSEGIDFAVINDFVHSLNGGSQVMWWNTGTNTWNSLGTVTFYEQADGGNYALEWRVPTSSLTATSDLFSFWGGVTNLGPSTLDVTNEANTPEPTTLALLGLGLGGLYLRRRRQR